MSDSQINPKNDEGNTPATENKRAVAAAISANERIPETPKDLDFVGSDDEYRKAFVDDFNSNHSERYRLQTGFIRQEQQLRAKGIISIFVMVCSWLLFVAAILVVNGCSSGEDGFKVFKISDTVLAALLGTSIVTISGFLLTIIKYLYPEKPWWISEAYPNTTGYNLGK